MRNTKNNLKNFYNFNTINNDTFQPGENLKENRLTGSMNRIRG